MPDQEAGNPEIPRVPREQAMQFLIGHDLPPVITVRPGESFLLETEDALAGRIRSADQLPIPAHVPELARQPPELNPCAGPIHVAGACRGDVLAVHIEKILVDPQGVTCFVPDVGPLSDSYRWSDCRVPTRTSFDTSRVPAERHEMDAESERPRDWDLQPFIGTIGTAPDRETEASLVGQGSWGGNMDCREIREGSTIYLNCYHDGGLLFVGDAMGRRRIRSSMDRRRDACRGHAVM